MALEVARAVLSSPVWLVQRWAVDCGAVGSCLLVVGVDVGYEYRKARALGGHRAGRGELILGVGAVQPDVDLAGFDFAVDWVSGWVSGDAAGGEAERFNEKA